MYTAKNKFKTNMSAKIFKCVYFTLNRLSVVLW